jgi:hypothetical protein
MMSWIVPLLKRLAWRVRVIPDRTDPTKPYMTRYYLLGGPEHKWFVLCLHQIHVGDPTDLHDHPAAYFSLILTGGYLEQTPEGVFRRRPGHFRFRSSRSAHRLQLDPKVGSVHTLFIMGPRRRNWGFRAPSGWVRHEKYLGEI